MLGVGLEGDGLVSLPHSEEHPGDREVDHRGQRVGQEAERGILDRLRLDEAADGGDHDADGGRYDQQPFEAAGEVFGLGVAVGVLLVGRARRHPEGVERHQRGHQVGERLQRVGEEADRAGDDVGRRLEPDGDDRRDDGQDREAQETAALDHAPASGSMLATAATVSGELPSARLLTRR
jgi:hypothetical protein